MSYSKTRTSEYEDIIVIDLETLGVKRDAVVMSIGIAIINTKGKLIYSHETLLSTEVQTTLHNRKIEERTLSWWKQPERLTEYKRLSNFRQSQTLYSYSLIDIADLLREALHKRSATIWGNSAEFDLGMLKALFDEEEIEIPWEYWQEQDYRTACRIAKLRGFCTTTTNLQAHNAEADAVYEAYTLQSALKLLLPLKGYY